MSASDQLDDIDLAVLVYREDGVWRLEEIDDSALHDAASIAEQMQRRPGDFGTLAMISIDEDFFILGRVAGARPRWLLSDVTAANDWELAHSVVEALGIPMPDDDDDQVPAGDLMIVADLGVPAVELAAMLDDYDLFPDEVMGSIARIVGFGEPYDEFLGVPAP